MSIRRAGILDIRIDIQRKSETQDNAGEPVESWSTIATRWSDPAPLLGTERLVGESLVAKEQVHFRIRYDASLADLSARDRIIMPAGATPNDTNIYNIIQASRVDRNDEILILAYRYANAP